MKNVLGILKKAAPWVAAGIGSISPGPIAIVANVVAKKLGGSEVKADAESLTSALSPLMTTDEGRQKLAEIEAETQKAFNDLKIKEIDEIVMLEQTAAADRASARTLQSLTRSKVLPTLGMTIFISYCLVLLGMGTGFLHYSDVSLELVSGLRDAFIAVVMFYFGSSAQSHAQTDLQSQKK